MTASSNLDLVMPPNWGASAWRYMSLNKFQYILQTESIFFSRLTKFADLYEGLAPECLKRFFGDGEQDVDGQTLALNTVAAHSKYACVSCWHVNEEESP